MKSSLTIKDRMIRSVSMRRSEIILRSDFERMGSQSQISRVLGDFVREGTSGAYRTWSVCQSQDEFTQRQAGSSPTTRGTCIRNTQAPQYRSKRRSGRG